MPPATNPPTPLLRPTYPGPKFILTRDCPKWTALGCKPSLQSTLHKPKYENSTTQNCTQNVLNKYYYSHNTLTTNCDGGALVERSAHTSPSSPLVLRLLNPGPLGGPRVGRLAEQPPPPRGSPVEKDKIRNGYISPAFLGRLFGEGGQKQAQVGNGQKKVPSARPAH